MIATWYQISIRFTCEFDQQFPGFENEIHGLRIEESSSG
ncbi:MAG: hypothetical protein KME49_23685 [Brasilonema octagenarum HA4186-MV1]|nr:hypothetical protein [Brasilonema octagenarum HA4186-MV1]